MRLSPWHMELAKRIAQGQTNRDIMREIKVSGSRLSVLKANPLFAQQVTKYRQQEDEKYSKAMKVFGDKAEEVAKEVVRLAESSLTPARVKLDAGLAILDKVAESEGHTGAREDEEVVFEHLLRVTKKGLGLLQGVDTSDAALPTMALDDAQRDLDEDFVDIDDVDEAEYVEMPLRAQVQGA